MLNERRKLFLGAAAVLIFLVAVSYSGYPQYEICQHPNENQTICANYHIIPYFVVEIVGGADRHEGFFSLLTGAAVAFFTLGLVIIGFKADRHFRVVERAYVKLSHHPPGIYWENPRPADLFYGQQDSLEYWVRADLRVKNFGKTPAHVTEICLACKFLGEGEKLPGQPDYSEGTIGPAHAFLVADDEFTHMTRVKIAIEDKRSIWDGAKRLFVFGYVEYRDKFGTHHRGRYARRYEHGPTAPTPIIIHTGQSLIRNEAMLRASNLIFVDEMGYNSDVAQRSDGSWPET
jgi:hypothetical protein